MPCLFQGIHFDFLCVNNLEKMSNGYNEAMEGVEEGNDGDGGEFQNGNSYGYAFYFFVLSIMYDF